MNSLSQKLTEAIEKNSRKRFRDSALRQAFQLGTLQGILLVLPENEENNEILEKFLAIQANS